MGEKDRKIKCVIWDLDNTVWDGVLIEDSDVRLRGGVTDVMDTLDRRGILQSVASKNDYDLAMSKLKEFGLDHYFIYPEIHWGSKSASVKKIVESINIGIDTIAFIDDQAFEREEVSFAHPRVLCIDALDLEKVPFMAEMNPRFITDDSKLRREMYQNDIRRNNAEERFDGPSEEFLASLDMVFTISPVQEGDLERAEELTIRTHQLNTTGYTYSYEELNELRQSGDHKLFVAALDDKYGTYGKIGLALVECKEVWTIKLLLMSCRVMSRGVGTIMLNHILGLAREAGKSLRAEFVENDRNRMMMITYRFAGFTEVEKEGTRIVLENDLSQIQPFPDYVRVNIGD